MTFGINSISMTKCPLKIMEPLDQGVFYMTIDKTSNNNRNSSSILLFRRHLGRGSHPTPHCHQDRHSNKGGLLHKVGPLETVQKTVQNSKDRAGWQIRCRWYGAGLVLSLI